MHAEHIYNLMTGLYRCESGTNVEDAFEMDDACMAYMERIYLARIRIGERLHSDLDDADLLEIVHCYEALQKRIAIQMYQYGKAGI